MTREQFTATIQHRIGILSSLEYRAKRAHALGLKITGWVLTEDESRGLCAWVGCRVGPSSCYGTRQLVKRIIPNRTMKTEQPALDLHGAREGTA
jgi:hypothetical protein